MGRADLASADQHVSCMSGCPAAGVVACLMALPAFGMSMQVHVPRRALPQTSGCVPAAPGHEQRGVWRAMHTVWNLYQHLQGITVLPAAENASLYALTSLRQDAKTAWLPQPFLVSPTPRPLAGMCSCQTAAWGFTCLHAMHACQGYDDRFVGTRSEFHYDASTYWSCLIPPEAYGYTLALLIPWSNFTVLAEFQMRPTS